MYLHHTAPVNNRMTPPEVHCNNTLLVYIQINVSCSIVATHYVTGWYNKICCCICCCCHCISLSCFFSKLCMSLPTIPTSVSLLAAGSSASNMLAESIGVNLFNDAIFIIHESATPAVITLFSRGQYIWKSQVLQNSLKEEIQRIMQLDWWTPFLDPCFHQGHIFDWTKWKISQ